MWPVASFLGACRATIGAANPEGIANEAGLDAFGRGNCPGNFLIRLRGADVHKNPPPRCETSLGREGRYERSFDRKAVTMSGKSESPNSNICRSR
jgi:hypothetical protein